MKLLPAPAQAWYDNLAPRERRAVLIGGAALALLILYLAVVQPMISSHARLVREVHQRREVLAYINRMAPRLKNLSPGGAGGHIRAGQSVFATVSAAAQNSDISGAVQRLEQAGNGGVRLSLSGAPFDALMRWLGKMSTEHGIVIADANIQRADNPGTVNATITLKGS